MLSVPQLQQIHGIQRRRVINAPEAQSRSLFRRLAPMVLVALALRLMAVGFLYPERLNPDRDHAAFAGEAGRIAHSLVEGKGFSSPMVTVADTGPTAGRCPRYPARGARAVRLGGEDARG